VSFESYSQAGQDRFVWEIFGRKETGSFIDIGSGHAWEYSNTFGLEKKGWCGFLFDQFHYQKDPSCSSFVRRRAVMVEGDVISTLPKWIDPAFTEWISYLSIDVDGDSARALAVALDLPVSYGVITIEHDWYHRGRDLRDLERHLLTTNGYDLVCQDVSWGQGPYEDWWVNPKVVPQATRDRFRCRNRWWRDIPNIMADL
jgi:hypothetical protein